MMYLKAATLRYIAITATLYNVAGGAAGYIDTDCSASVPNNAKAVFVRCVPSGDQYHGARKYGDTADPKVQYSLATYWLTAHAAGHIDLYRSAAANAYTILGYFA